MRSILFRILWFAKRKEIISQRGSKCEICGSTKKIHVHHKTYARMGNEKPEDLQVVCASCHSEIHGRDLTQYKGAKIIKLEPKKPKKVKKPKTGKKKPKKKYVWDKKEKSKISQQRRKFLPQGTKEFLEYRKRTCGY